MKKYIAIIFICFIAGMFVFPSQLVFADDDEYEEHEYEGEEEEENEVVEETGELIGWAGMVSVGGAVLFFPLKRLAPVVMNNFSNYKKQYRDFLLFFKKWHVGFGILALSLSIFHGVLMFLAEGELEFREYVGIGAVIALILSAIFGSILTNKLNSSIVRMFHITSFVLVFLFAAIHIALS
ncbi:hypothetical protein LC040_07745 [Bacillus tianshenii]|nr:hypothetical protein LC040_07745 [Bacillus tianshenii]